MLNTAVPHRVPTVRDDARVDVYGRRGVHAVPCFGSTSDDFSLVSEPWIPVLTTSGMQTRGLARVFDADVIGVASGDDLEDTALTRLLLAIHLAANGVGLTPSDWVDAQRARFNLFDPVQPFWQNAGMAKHVELPGAAKPLVAASYRHTGRGSTAVNVWHNESGLIFDAAAVARLVVVRQQFSVGSRQPFPFTAYGATATSAKASVAALRPFVWVDDGRLAASLRATGELVPANPLGRFWFTWPTERRPADDGDPSGVLDGLTWQSRSMLLVRGLAGPTIMICEGLRWPECGTNEHYSDETFVPHTVFARSRGSEKYTIQRVHPDRPAWRQLATMCSDPDYPIAAIAAANPTPSGRRWRVGGLGSYQAGISGPIAASFPAPVDPAALRQVLAAMTRAYQEVGAVTGALAEAVSGFAGYRWAIPTHTGLHADFEQIATDVALGHVSADDAERLVRERSDSIARQAYLSVSRVRPLTAARVSVRRTHIGSREGNKA